VIILEAIAGGLAYAQDRRLLLPCGMMNSGGGKMIVKLKSAMRDVLMALGLIETPRLQPVPLRTQQLPRRQRRG